MNLMMRLMDEREIGRAEGIILRNRELVKRNLNDGFQTEEIARFLGISEEEVHRIAAELNSKE